MPPHTRPTRLTRLTALVAAAASFAAATTLAHPGWHDDALVPISADAATRLEDDLDAGLRLPEDLVCAVDGPLLEVVHDPAPATSGYAGIVVVSGLPVRVPVSVPVQVGDNPEDQTAFVNLTAEPDGYPSFLGRAASVAGTFSLVDGHLRCTADALIVEVGHPPLVGVVTENGPAGLLVLGVRVVPHADPRVAPFVRVLDLAGQPVPIEDILPGTAVAVNGDYSVTDGRIDAILIEVDAVLPPAPGEPDHLSILRAEARSARPELRVRGFSNNASALVSLYDYSDGSKGAELASGIPVDGADGAWEFRGDIRPVTTTPDGIPRRVLAQTQNGGEATSFVSVR